MPLKSINPCTVRLEENKCVLLGGFAKLEYLKVMCYETLKDDEHAYFSHQGLPFYFTFFVSNSLKLHQTESTRADSFLKDHVGKLIFPPATYHRVEEVGPYESIEFEVSIVDAIGLVGNDVFEQIVGDGWKQSSTDIIIPGIGWIAVTGAGIAHVRITAPVGTKVSTRSSILPFEAKFSTAKFTGNKMLKNSSK